MKIQPTPSLNPCPVCGGINWICCVIVEEKVSLIIEDGSYLFGGTLVDGPFENCPYVDFCLDCETGFTEG